MRTTYESKYGLRALLDYVQPNSIGIEIGSYAGESAEVFAQSGKFEALHCVDLWEEGYYSDRTTKDAEEYFDRLHERHAHIIRKTKLDCRKVCEAFPPRSFDFIYIDGNHSCEMVRGDILNALILVKQGGIISGHDYSENTPGVIKAVNETFGKPDHIFPDTSWMIKRK